MHVSQQLKSRGSFNHLMKAEWNLFVLSSDFKLDGRLFQMMGPEYAKLCLKISLWGLGVTNECPDNDLSVGKFSLGILS